MKCDIEVKKVCSKIESCGQTTYTKSECLKVIKDKTLEKRRFLKNNGKEKRRDQHGWTHQKSLVWIHQGTIGSMDKCPFCDACIRVSKRKFVNVFI